MFKWLHELKMSTLYLSRLQHYLFCPRQFALIELEDQWAENQLTAEGQIMHERVNSGENETRGDIRTVRTLPLGHRTLELEGVADVVEYHRQADGTVIPYPIEYKRGKPKSHRADEVQLMAQALCLEDMHQCTVPEGALFYGKTRRRQVVVFDQALRDLTLNAIKECQHIIQTGITPKPEYSTAKCRNCSLNELCHPKIFNKNAKAWFSKQLSQSLNQDPNEKD